MFLQLWTCLVVALTSSTTGQYRYRLDDLPSTNDSSSSRRFDVPIIAYAFNFTNSNPTQCDDITINWSGGEPPFRLLVIPPGWPVKNISIPSSAYHNANKSGTYTMQLALPQSQRVMFSISDATGITAGGISPLFTVGGSISGTQCNTAGAMADFWFSLDSDLVECKAYPFTNYPNASQPVNIYGFVPSSQSFTLHPPIGNSYNWTNDILVAGTSVSFSMIDSKGRDGGTSEIRVVKWSGDESCLSTSSSSTSASPASSSSSGAGFKPWSSQSKTGFFVGSIVGALVPTLLVVFLGVFWHRRRRYVRVPIIKSSDEEIDLLHPPVPFPPNAPYSQFHDRQTPSPFERENDAAPISWKAQVIQSMENDYLLTPPVPMAPRFSQHSGNTNPVDPRPWGSRHTSLGTPTTNLFESREAFGDSAARVVVHTDIAEITNDPLELPPQYVADRPPIIGLSSGSNHLFAEEYGHTGR